MKLRDQISADIKTAMRAKDAPTRDALRVLIAEIGRAEDAETENKRREAVKKLKKELAAEGKTMELGAVVAVDPIVYGDSEVQSLIIKSVKSLHTIGDEDSKSEIELLESYLPSMMNDDELKDVIENAIRETGAQSMKEMGKVMGFLKENHNGQYDGKMASTLIKKLL
jgi:hypothetical protein